MSTQAQQLAFPGAEGYAAYATGGRGGQVVHVTNLNASGAGSLADAVSKSGRTVVFDVGGIIDITNASITIASNITIAGQTAPGEGITIYGGRVIASNSKNVIMRYIRMRGGKSVNSSKCTLTLDYCENFIMDHCSVSWGPWDNVHIKDANNVTWQNCIIAEGIEPQRFGSITDGTRNWTISHCLWIDNKSRNPKMKCGVQYYNNVVYNYAMGVMGGHSAGDNYQDLMNNYFIAGPEGSYKYFDQWTETDHLYSTGNYYDGNCNGTLDGTLITDYNGATPMQKPNFNTTHPQNLETAAQAYATVVEHVGASRVRDVHDRRYIEQLTSLGTKGSFIANEGDVGGIGTLAGGTRPTDADNDGMADEWERANGLNPQSNDANAYTLGGGYTNIEHYINSLAVKTFFLSAPQNLKAQMGTNGAVRLTWSNGEVVAKSIVVEVSDDGRYFTEAKRVSGKVTATTLTGLTAGHIYYFRLKAITDEAESAYSAIVSVNNEYMQPGHGTAAGTTTFAPSQGYLYRIINYATIPYNSGTSLGGVPKYLTFTAGGSLGASEEFQWDSPAQLWEITPAEGCFYLRNCATGTYMAPTNGTTSDGDDRIGQTTTPTLLTINYTGDQQPSQAGSSAAISMYRINCPQNKNQQIRARGFGNDWIWGSGTFDRADMVFTFAAVPASEVMVLAGFDPAKCYNIYSFGTMSNASAATATPDIQRRYLCCVPSADGSRDSLVYRIGLSEQQIRDGAEDPVGLQRAALWTLEADPSGRLYYVRNQESGAYMAIDNYLTSTPTTIYPCYAKHDNGHAAFYLDADERGKRLFNVGNPDADGKGGPLTIFGVHADRTRLRWVIEPTNIEPLPTAIGTPRQHTHTAQPPRYYTLQGTRLQAPQRGICIEQRTEADGSVTTRKVLRGI